MLLAFVGKLVVFPAAVLGLGMVLALPFDLLTIAVIYAMSPTAASSYTLARQLGGDAPLMAAIVTLQTLLAIVTIPITIQIVSSLG